MQKDCVWEREKEQREKRDIESVRESLWTLLWILCVWHCCRFFPWYLSVFICSLLPLYINVFFSSVVVLLLFCSTASRKRVKEREFLSLSLFCSLFRICTAPSWYTLYLCAQAHTKLTLVPSLSLSHTTIYTFILSLHCIPRLWHSSGSPCYDNLDGAHGCFRSKNFIR